MGYGNKILISNDYCIHSDFCRQSNNGLNFEAGNHVKNLGFVFEILYKEYIRIGGNEEAWERMTTQNTIDVLDI